jgi:uncharacterized RDD family membrane protein YckC
MDDGWDQTSEEADEHVLAGRGRRLLAVLINTAMFVALPFGLALAIDGETFSTGSSGVDAETGRLAEQGSGSGTLGIGVLVACWLVFGIASGIMVAKNGQSIGKAAVGIRVVRTDGSRAGFWRIAGLRWFVMVLASGLVSLIGLVDTLFIFRRDRRCLHDLIADTMVVMDAPARRRTAVETQTSGEGHPSVPFGRPQSPPAW